MNYSDYSVIRVSVDGGVARVVIDNPPINLFDLALYADMLRRPRFDAKEIDRVKASWIAGIKQEKVNPGSVALRVLPPLLYGAAHPYAAPLTGSGTEASKIGRAHV